MAKRRQPTTDANNEADARLVALGRELRRTIRRASRQRRSASGSSAWSLTIEDAFKLVDQISSAPAGELEGFALKPSAITWYLTETNAVLDLKGMRQLRDLDREATRLTH